jgi:recombination protein RecA
MGDSLPGLQARLMSQALRKLTAIVAKSKTCVVFINQLREKIGVMFGSPETTTGGKALKFYSSVRLDIRRIETLKNGQDAVGNRVRVKTVKNKVAPPFREAIFDIIFGEGISREGTVLDMAVELNVVEKAGSWFAFEGNRIGQGRDAVRLFLKDNQRLCDQIDKKVREEMARQAKAKQAEAEAKAAANAAKYADFPTPSQIVTGVVAGGKNDGARIDAVTMDVPKAAAKPAEAKPAAPAPAPAAPKAPPAPDNKK